MNLVVSRLIKHFGTQQCAAEAIGVDQTTISGWLRGKHLISVENAIRIQAVTLGAFQAVDLCPSIAKFSLTLERTIRANGAADQSADTSGNPSSTFAEPV
ncbi:Cro/CI family transcriptional regulator [Pseudomonas japonica]|uniref:Cro/CI family transcriptional regulator n=1 Tax=Pseudomonas japonica TaxID=256466 RepID=UPI003A848745